MNVEFSPVETSISPLHVGYREHVLAKLAKINLRLAKLGADPATVDFGPIVKHTEKRDGWEHSWFEYEFVEVHGYEVKLAGWAGVASLDHTLGTDEAFVTRFPGHFDDDIPEHFRHRGPVCDHCKIAIRRNLTILFRHDDGRWVQVGTSCVLDYIGVDPANVLWLANGLRSFADDEDGDGPKGGRYHVDPAAFLAAAAEATRINGFTPSKAVEGAWPTRDQANRLVHGRMSRKDLEANFPGLDYARGAAAAEAILAWVAESTEQSEFMVSARLACRAAVVTERTEGLLAALPQSWSKATERQAQKVAAVVGNTSEYLGTVGAKLSVVGEVIAVRSFESNYGTQKLVVVKLPTGEEVATFGSGRTLWEAEVGMTVRFDGKVKAHEDKGYGKRTMLKLAKLYEVVPDGAVSA